MALELTCSTFHKKGEYTLSITEEAARIILNDERVNNLEHLPFNYKALLFYLREGTPIPLFTCPTCTWRIGGFNAKANALLKSREIGR